MKNQKEYKAELEEKIKRSLGMCWSGELNDYAGFVSEALNKHLYDVMNKEDKFKPSFDEWENFKMNNDNLVDMIYELGNYQGNEEFSLPNIFETS